MANDTKADSKPESPTEVNKPDEGDKSTDVEEHSQRDSQASLPKQEEEQSVQSKEATESTEDDIAKRSSSAVESSGVVKQQEKTNELLDKIVANQAEMMRRPNYAVLAP